jgi:hypothetical protein
MMRRPRHQPGFTLLLAALVGSLVLALGLSIVAIARKSVTLSSIGRDSQFAFYAADTAAECALYWDIRFSKFASSTPVGELRCDGEILVLSTPGSSPFVEPYEISFQYEPNGYCAEVTVTKSAVHPRTVIHADGYSVSCAEVAQSARSLQRSVELRY